MTKSLAFLLLLSWGTESHASLGTYLQQQSAGRTANTMDYGGICGSVGKVYQGYSWSMGGGKTTFQVTCSGVQVEISCKGWPTFSECQSTSAAGQTGLGSGCICKAEHPTCKRNGWCYKGRRWSSSNCPGSCTASATTPPSAPAPPPPPPPAPAGCTCPASYPSCYNGNNWCYKSPSSNDYTHTCGGKCTADHPSPAPSPPTSGAAGAQAATTGNCAGQEQLSQSQAQEMLDLHNQFRACVGTPPLQWNAALQCQAQSTQDEIGAFKHSSSYSKPISAGENLATGTSVSMAAWMWFTEYTQQGGSGTTGHYTAMVWKDTTHLGCGIQHGGGGVIRCQYAATAPNYQGQYAANVPAFHGEASKFAACGVSIATVKRKVQQFQGWGILSPNRAYSSSLGLFDASGAEVAWTDPLSKTSASVVAAAGVLFVVFGVVGMRRRVRRDQSPDTDAELLMVESAE